MPNLDIHIATTADNSGAVEAQAAVANLTHEVKTGTGEHENYREKQHEILEGMHMIALMTGGELREGLHETGLGMRLLGSLTGEMSLGIVGAAAAVGTAIPIIVGFFKEAHEKAAEETKKMQEAIDENIKKVGETVTDAHLERITEMAMGFKDSLDSTRLLTQEFPNTEKAINEFGTAALENAGLLATAQHNIAVALGQQVDAVKELEAAEELASKKRELTMLQAIQSQEEQLENAKKRKLKAEEDAKLIEDEISRNKAELDKSREALLDARGRKKELEIGQNQDIPYTMNQAMIESPDSPYNRALADRKEAEVGSKMEGPELDSRISSSEKEIKKLSDDVRKLERQKEHAETVVEAAQKVIDEDTSAASVNIAKLQDNFVSQDLAGKSKELLDIGKANTDKFKDVLGKMTVTVGAASESYDNAESIVTKGQIDAKNLPKAIDDLGKLIAAYQAHAVGMNGNYTENIRQMVILQAK